MTRSATATATYTETDVEDVVRRFTTDLMMIADSSGAATRDLARDYGHDVELLAKEGHLDTVDVTLLTMGVEIRAVRYVMDTAAGNLTSSRPGGVLWPRVSNPSLRIVLRYTATFDEAAREKAAGRLRLAWVPTDADTGHGGLTASGGRDYASHGFGMQRKDWTA